MVNSESVMPFDCHVSFLVFNKNTHVAPMIMLFESFRWYYIIFVKIRHWHIRKEAARCGKTQLTHIYNI